MRNTDIVFLVQNGILLMTAHEVSPAHAYKAFKLRKALYKAYNDIAEREKALMEEYGIEEGKKVEDEAKAKAFSEMRMALMEDDTELEGLRQVPHDVWCAMQKENMAKKVKGNDVDLLSGSVEMLLEGVFWLPPAEETPTE